MAKRKYLDDAAAARIDPAVQKAMEPFLNEQFGNPASLHQEGVAARTAVENARRSIADGLVAHADELVFTSGGTESNNLALFGVAGLETAKRHILISNIEHPSVAEAAAELERRGFVVEEVPVEPDGRINPRTFARALRDDTFLVSIIFANNEIGTVQPIAELSKLCRKRGSLFHTDACQAAPWLPLAVDKLHVDLMTLNAAKLGGPKGVGALYVRRGTKLKPQLVGGGQERGLRSGTENVPGIVGFAAAFALARQRQKQTQPVASVRDALITRLTAIPGVTLNGHPTERLPNNVNVTVEGVSGETLVLALDAEGIAASSGSACSSIHATGSTVLRAIGRSQEGNLRFSLDWSTTERDVAEVAQTLEAILTRQRPLNVRWENVLATKKEPHVQNA